VPEPQVRYFAARRSQQLEHLQARLAHGCDLVERDLTTTSNWILTNFDQQSRIQRNRVYIGHFQFSKVPLNANFSEILLQCYV
jgi:hypothetical protein